MAELKRELANRALKHHKKQSDELNELRRKTKHQEAALRTLTQELARLEKGGDSFELTRLSAENEALKAENAKLRSDLGNAAAKGTSSRSSTHEKEAACDPRDAMKYMDKDSPLHEVWKNKMNSALIQDKASEPSQGQRFANAVHLHINVRDTPLKSDDPLCDAMDPIDERNQRRVLHSLILWSQATR